MGNDRQVTRPAVRQRPTDAAGWQARQSLQHALQASAESMPVERCRRRQAHDRSGAFSSAKRPGEHPVAALDRHGSGLCLDPLVTGASSLSNLAISATRCWLQRAHLSSPVGSLHSTSIPRCSAKRLGAVEGHRRLVSVDPSMTEQLQAMRPLAAATRRCIRLPTAPVPNAMAGLAHSICLHGGSWSPASLGSARLEGTGTR